MAIILDGVVSGPTGYLNGASVDAWLATRFTSVPGAGDPPPAGQPDAGPVLSGTTYGGPGQWRMEVPTVAAYYVRVTYPVGATNAKSYWAYDDSLVLTTGPQGVQGVQGYQGSQGTQGTQGVTGAQGVQGSVGFTGPQGFQGAQGPQGNMGAQGVQGTQGTQGYQGFQGLTGPQGTQGAPSTVQGPQGYQGFQGLTGPQGNQGTMGNTGAQGPQGFQGATGPQGTQGYQGDMGNQGAQGYQGYQGTQGAPSTVQGPQGYQGYQGYQGAQGAPSTVQGPQGYQGTPGQMGFQGYQGATGSQGPQGVSGPQGSQGSSGQQGPQGAQGSQGFQGTQGVGVPSGGTTGQALIKNSGTNYDTGWQSQLPLSGGTMSGNINLNSVARITNAVGAQSSTDVARADSVPGYILPAVHGPTAWNYDLTQSSNTLALTLGVQYFMAITVPYGFTPTNYYFACPASNAGNCTGFYIGIYNTNGALLTSSSPTNYATQINAGNASMVKVAISGSVTLNAGTYVVGFLATGGTTGPALYANSQSSGALNNLGCPATTSGKLDQRSCTAGTGLASLYNPLNTTPSQSNRIFFVGLS